MSLLNLSYLSFSVYNIIIMDLDELLEEFNASKNMGF